MAAAGAANVSPRWGWAWILLVGVVAAALFGPTLQQTEEDSGAPAAQELRLRGPCDPVADICIAVDGETTLKFSIEGEPRPMRPFPVTVGLEGVREDDVEAVLIGFSMAGMDMGPNRYRLLPQAAGRWSGEVTLPICTTGRTDWIAQVEAFVGPAVLTAAFELELLPPK